MQVATILIKTKKRKKPCPTQNVGRGHNAVVVVAVPSLLSCSLSSLSLLISSSHSQQVWGCCACPSSHHCCACSLSIVPLIAPCFHPTSSCSWQWLGVLSWWWWLSSSSSPHHHSCHAVRVPVIPVCIVIPAPTHFHCHGALLVLPCCCCHHSSCSLSSMSTPQAVACDSGCGCGTLSSCHVLALLLLSVLTPSITLLIGNAGSSHFLLLLYQFPVPIVPGLAAPHLHSVSSSLQQ